MRQTQARLSRWLAGVERKEDGNVDGGAEELNRAFLTHFPENNRWRLSLPSSNVVHSFPASRNWAGQGPMSC